MHLRPPDPLGPAGTLLVLALVCGAICLSIFAALLPIVALRH